MKPLSLKVEDEDGGSEEVSKVEEGIEELDEGDRSNILGSTGEGFSMTMDGMSNSLGKVSKERNGINGTFQSIWGSEEVKIDGKLHFFSFFNPALSNEFPVVRQGVYHLEYILLCLGQTIPTLTKT